MVDVIFGPYTQNPKSGLVRVRHGGLPVMSARPVPTVPPNICRLTASVQNLCFAP